MFQSLFSWSYLSKKAANVISSEEYKFQSLFSWSYLSKHLRGADYRVEHPVSILIFLELPFKVLMQKWFYLDFRVSILIFLELPFKDAGYKHKQTLIWVFQSLFSWSYLSKTTILVPSRCVTLSFNPYFPGVTFQSYWTRVKPVTIKGFNPYFPGVTFQRKGKSHIINHLKMFQSLFSWSYLSKFEEISEEELDNLSFNPYFPGVTFQRKLNHRDPGGCCWFQSLFSWSYLSKLPCAES